MPPLCNSYTKSIPSLVGRFPRVPRQLANQITSAEPGQWRTSRASLAAFYQRGSLQLFDGLNSAMTRSLPQIFFPALWGYFWKCAFRSAK